MKRVSMASGGLVPVPVPVTGTVWGLLAPLSVTISVPDRVPVAVGEKLMDTLQLVPAASVRPEQPSLTSVKSRGFAPRVAALLMNSGAPPVLATVTDCAALVVPIACAPNVSAVGVKVTAGPDAGGGGGGVAPLPERETLWGLLEALSVKASAAVRAPAVVGLKATETLQLAPAASVTPEQVSVCLR